MSKISELTWVALVVSFSLLAIFLIRYSHTKGYNDGYESGREVGYHYGVSATLDTVNNIVKQRLSNPYGVTQLRLERYSGITPIDTASYFLSVGSIISGQKQ